MPLEQTLAANVDQALIVFAVAEPRCDFYLLDRFLVASFAGEVEPLVCFNKCDLVRVEDRAKEQGLYAELGFRVLYTSAHSGEGVEELREVMTGRTSVLCGPSGVGKSSLFNAVAPGLALRTGEIGPVTHKGRHATSATTLLEIPFGGWVADTPGLRQLGFHVFSREAVCRAFPEIAPHLGRCEYSNCTHHEEEGARCGRRWRPGK